jgi:hypothetical protein
VLFSRQGAPFLPWKSVPGCALALLSDRGITTVDAAVASPNDVSTANWAQTNLSSRTTDTITDSNDGSSVQHYVLQSPVTGLVSGKPYIVSVEFHTGTKSLAWVSDNVNWSVIVDLSNGNVTYNPAGYSVTVTALAGSWYRISITALLGTALKLGIAGTATTDGYQGNGTGTIQVRNVQVTQRNVSSWADVVTSSGLAATQGTAANQPVLISSDSGFFGHPTLAVVGTQYVNVAIAPAQPYTCYHVAKSDSAVNAQLIYEDKVNTTCQFSMGTGAPYTHVYIYAGTAALAVTSTIVRDQNTHVGAGIFAGASSAVCWDSAAIAVSGNAGTIAVTNLRIGSTLVGRVAAFFVFLGAHDLVTRTRIMRWLGRKCGVMVA